MTPLWSAILAIIFLYKCIILSKTGTHMLNKFNYFYPSIHMQAPTKKRKFATMVVPAFVCR